MEYIDVSVLVAEMAEVIKGQKKIYFLIGQLCGGGAEHQCLLQARELACRGHMVEICSLSRLDVPLAFKISHDLLCTELCKLDVASKYAKPFKMVKAVFRLRKKLKKDAIILYAWLETGHFLSYFACLFLPIPVVWAIRNSGIQKGFGYWKINTLIRVNQKLSGKKINLLSNSQSGLESYGALNYKHAASEIVYNFIDEAKFYKWSYALIQKERAKFGFFSNDYVILSLSRLTPIKNIEAIIEAIPLIQAHVNKKITLLIAGSGNKKYRDKLQSIIKAYAISEQVRWLGYQKNTGLLYNVADLYILASKSEGLSNTLLEAISCGIDAIATDVGDNRFCLDSRNVIHGFSATDILRTFVNKVPEQGVGYSNTTEKRKLYQFFERVENSQ